jgi:hypothetical protein
MLFHCRFQFFWLFILIDDVACIFRVVNWLIASGRSRVLRMESISIRIGIQSGELMRKEVVFIRLLSRAHLANMFGFGSVTFHIILRKNMVRSYKIINFLS